MDMLNAVDELDGLADRLRHFALKDDAPVLRPAKDLAAAAERLDACWSQGWLGYHARVYYADFAKPPAGAQFSTEWGFYDPVIGGSVGNWRVFAFDDVVAKIYADAGNPDLSEIKALSEEARSCFNDVKADALSILEILQGELNDGHLGKLRDELKTFVVPSAAGLLGRRSPTQFMTRDPNLGQQQPERPPHLFVQCEAMELLGRIHSCEGLARLIGKVTSHVRRLQKLSRRATMMGTSVFIGHGRSAVWRDLKDFVKDRLLLPYDEFNRVPVAGITNITRLNDMLDSAAVAFVIMTAEDEQVDGRVHARMNVVHEVGLFQGRLGFTKAIVLLEEGCEEFGNIQGLGQIRFPKGNIKAVFEDIRAVLEREDVLRSETQTIASYAPAGSPPRDSA